MRLIRLCVVSILFMLLGACGHFPLEPWVAPYEREYLADEIMSFSRDPLANKYRQHVYDTREGARGAGIASGGGCGCN